MFGTYRTFLALMVVALHLGGLSMGGYAVFGFYVLSGYLMTLIMQNNYGYSALGFYKYALNRFLRIYPIYWVSIVFSAIWFGILVSDLPVVSTRLFSYRRIFLIWLEMYFFTCLP